MKSVKFASPRYRVVNVLRKSKARYAAGIDVGDILEFSTKIGRTTGGANGNYALDIRIEANGKFLATCSQNEFLALFEKAEYSFSRLPIFELIEEI